MPEAARFYDEQERTASGWAARASVEASRLAATASAFDRVAERPWLAIPPRPE